jgi:hypothetical protein
MFGFFSRQPKPPPGAILPDLEKWLRKFEGHITLAVESMQVDQENQPPKETFFLTRNNYDPVKAYVDTKNKMEYGLAQVKEANSCLEIAQRLWPEGRPIFKGLRCFSDNIFLVLANSSKINELLAPGMIDLDDRAFDRTMLEINRLRKENWQAIRKGGIQGDKACAALKAVTGIEIMKTPDK